MNQRQLASVLFTAVGVFIAGSHLGGILIQLAALISPTPDIDPLLPGSQHLTLVWGLIGSALAVLVGCLLVVLRNRLANRLFPPASDTLSSRDVHAVALSVLGAYFVVQGLAQVAWARQFDWSAATQLVLGAGLFIGSRGLSRLWAFGRSARGPGNVGEGAV